MLHGLAAVVGQYKNAALDQVFVLFKTLTLYIDTKFKPSEGRVNFTYNLFVFGSFGWPVSSFWLDLIPLLSLPI